MTVVLGCVNHTLLSLEPLSFTSTMIYIHLQQKITLIVLYNFPLTIYTAINIAQYLI